MKLDLEQHEAIGEAELLEWLTGPRRSALPAWIPGARRHTLGRQAAHETYWLMHPRIRVLKTAPMGATVLDVGVGEGRLPDFRLWPVPERRDLTFLGISLEKPPDAQVRSYSEFALCDLDVDKPKFRAWPNTVIASHVIEHLKEPDGFLHWLATLLPRDARVYIEWPSWHTQFLPRWARMNELGRPIALNFYDDCTHITPVSAASLLASVEGAGFRIVEAGMIDMPYLAEQLRDIARAEGDAYFLDLAAWLKVKFASYVIAIR